MNLKSPPHPGPPQFTAGLTDDDLRGTMLASLRLLAWLCAVATAGFWWKGGWRSGALVVIGSVISAASLWEWMRLMAFVNRQMDAGGTASPMGAVLAGFFGRLALTLVVLYGSLKYLHGSVFALALGIGLGLFSLTIQALRLLKRWTV